MADPAYIVDGVLTDGEAWVAVGSTTISGTSTTSVTFTSTDDGQTGDFSQYMDLCFVCSGSAIYAPASILSLRYKINSDASNYKSVRMKGDRTSATGADENYNQLGQLVSSDPASYQGVTVAWFFDINSAKNKAILTQNGMDRGASQDGVIMLAGRQYTQPEPISSLYFYEPNGFSFQAGSRFDLWGILPRMVTA
jgi:hypothetical protein